MANIVEMKIIGEKEIEDYIKKLSPIAVKELKLENKRTLTGIEQYYRRKVKKHYKSGKLDKSISSSSKDGWMTGEAGSDILESIFIEFGTKAHIIRIKNKKILAAKLEDYGESVNEYGSGTLPMKSKDGKYVLFGKQVSHPGTKANPALLESWLFWMSGNKYELRVKQRMDSYK